MLEDFLYNLRKCKSQNYKRSLLLNFFTVEMMSKLVSDTEILWRCVDSTETWFTWGVVVPLCSTEAF